MAVLSCCYSDGFRQFPHCSLTAGTVQHQMSWALGHPGCLCLWEQSRKEAQHLPLHWASLHILTCHRIQKPRRKGMGEFIRQKLGEKANSQESLKRSAERKLSNTKHTWVHSVYWASTSCQVLCSGWDRLVNKTEVVLAPRSSPCI
jgi:hypothetical protein